MCRILKNKIKQISDVEVSSFVLKAFTFQVLYSGSIEILIVLFKCIHQFRYFVFIPAKKMDKLMYPQRMRL